MWYGVMNEKGEIFEFSDGHWSYRSPYVVPGDKDEDRVIGQLGWALGDLEVGRVSELKVVKMGITVVEVKGDGLKRMKIKCADKIIGSKMNTGEKRIVSEIYGFDWR